MPNTYTQLYIHSVFVVKWRQCLISPEWEDQLYKYITGILRNHQHRLLIINGMPDHIHMLFGLNPAQSISECMQTVKGECSGWINRMGFVRGRFEWQQGYAAFACDIPRRDAVYKYIENKKIHHNTKSFTEEYIELLNEFQVQFRHEYLFHPPLE